MTDPGASFLNPHHDYELARQIHVLERRIVSHPQDVSAQLEALFFKDYRHAVGLLQHYRRLCENERSRSFIDAIMVRMYTKYHAPPPPGYTDHIPRGQKP
jgi:hypothetical protein